MLHNLVDDLLTHPVIVIQFPVQNPVWPPNDELISQLPQVSRLRRERELRAAGGAHRDGRDLGLRLRTVQGVRRRVGLGHQGTRLLRGHR